MTSKVTTTKKSPKATRTAAIKVVVRLRDLRSEKREIEDEISGVQSEGIQFLKEHLKIKSLAFDDPDDQTVKITGTLVEPTSLILDEGKLKKKVGASVWNKITKRVLDRALLESAVASGLITPSTVASCASEEPKAPYIRITEKRS